MFKRFPDILRDLFDNVAKSGGKLTDFNPGSVLRTVLEAVAAVVEECYFWLELLVDKFFTSTSEGEWLDRRVNDFGLYRKLGAAATGVIVIGRDTPSPLGILIPAGTKWMTDGGIEFVTTADETIKVGQTTVEVSVAASIVGKGGNIPQDTMLKQAGMAITGLEWGKVKQMGGGIDSETDDELRVRIRPYFESLGRTTKQSIEAAALAIPGVKAATVKENVPEKGWFTLYVDDGSGSASPTLLETVRAKVEDYRAFTVQYVVTTAQKVDVDVQVTVVADNGVNAEAVRQSVKEQLLIYVNSLAMGEALLVAKICQLVMGVNGVSNVRVQGDDIAIGESQIARTTPDRVIVT